MADDSFQRFQNFLEKIQKDTYPEPPSPLHTEITKRMVNHLFEKYVIPKGACTLDIGCGQGVALKIFAARELQPVGITLNEADLTACREKGFEVACMDQSFLDFPDGHFDLVWCRHCLEHSIMPYFTLSEIYRVMKPSAHLYIEVPAPETICRHQANLNHYSVLGKEMWLELIRRTGFTIHEVM